MRSSLLYILVLFAFVTACKDDGIGTNPATIPGLFVTWELVKETTRCPGEDPVVVEPEAVVLLVLRKSTFEVTRDGEIMYEGTASYEGESIFFTPSPFPNNFLGAVAWAFDGAGLVLNSSESKEPGSLDICAVKRTYKIH